MTRARTNAMRKPGKERPAAARLGIQRPPTTKPHHRKVCTNTKPSAGKPVRQTAEGLDYRFLRSQPRVIGPGSLCKARPQQSEYNTTMQSKCLNSNAPESTLQIYTSAR